MLSNNTNNASINLSGAFQNNNLNLIDTGNLGFETMNQSNIFNKNSDLQELDDDDEPEIQRDSISLQSIQQQQNIDENHASINTDDDDDDYYSEQEQNQDFRMELTTQKLTDPLILPKSQRGIVHQELIYNHNMQLQMQQHLASYLTQNAWRHPQSQVDRYFNFGMDQTKWRLYVNKQIYMRFQRLLIQRELSELQMKRKQKKTSKRLQQGFNQYQMPQQLQDQQHQQQQQYEPHQHEMVSISQRYLSHKNLQYHHRLPGPNYNQNYQPMQYHHTRPFHHNNHPHYHQSHHHNNHNHHLGQKNYQSNYQQYDGKPGYMNQRERKASSRNYAPTNSMMPGMRKKNSLEDVRF